MQQVRARTRVLEHPGGLQGRAGVLGPGALLAQGGHEPGVADHDGVVDEVVPAHVRFQVVRSQDHVRVEPVDHVAGRGERPVSLAAPRPSLRPPGRPGRRAGRWAARCRRRRRRPRSVRRDRSAPPARPRSGRALARSCRRGSPRKRSGGLPGADGRRLERSPVVVPDPVPPGPWPARGPPRAAPPPSRPRHRVDPVLARARPGSAPRVILAPRGRLLDGLGQTVQPRLDALARVAVLASSASCFFTRRSMRWALPSMRRTVSTSTARAASAMANAPEAARRRA